MKDYLEHTYNIISISLDRHLYSKQRKINSELNTNLKDSNNMQELDILKKISNYSDKNDLRGAFKNLSIIQKTDSMSDKIFNQVIMKKLNL